MRWNEMNREQKQMLFRLAIVAALGIFLLVAGGKMDYEENLATEQSAVPAEEMKLPDSAASVLEQQLARTLMQVKGAGNVTVQITLYNSGRKEYARDVQRTERTAGETTELQEHQTTVQQAGKEGALLITEHMPEICGVLIVADGAGQAVVQEQMLQAAATLLQISTEQIIVLQGKGGA